MSLKDKYLNQPFPFKARSRGYRQVWANHGVSTTANFPQSLEVEPIQCFASYHGTCEDNCWSSHLVFIGFIQKSKIFDPANLLSENDKYVKAQLAVRFQLLNSSFCKRGRRMNADSMQLTELENHLLENLLHTHFPQSRHNGGDLGALKNYEASAANAGHYSRLPLMTPNWLATLAAHRLTSYRLAARGLLRLSALRKA